MKVLLVFLIAIGGVLFLPLGPALSQDMTDYCSIPPFIAKQGPPLVMIVMGRDHKLYYEAYNDASDLDNDGVLESTEIGYNHGTNYYGYFDSKKCYTYDGSQFNPAGLADAANYCNGSTWSGNFLNWLSMSRMDVLRKVLYGGHRMTPESSTETVLEGGYIPQDAHSWGKEYAGSDTNQLTPLAVPDAGNRHHFCVTSTSAYENDTHIIRVRENVSTDRIWDWASTERPVCAGTADAEYIVRVKVCDSAPTEGTDEYNFCKPYPSGYYKPVGLLQKYGVGDGTTKVCSTTFKPCTVAGDCDAEDGNCIDLARMYFGLITGSYTKNKSGGVLRRVMGDITDEIDLNTGVLDLTEDTTKGNIIRTLEMLQTVNFNYSGYLYDNCGWITTRGMDEGECEMWGNPIAEMMYESLRYFADTGSATSAFDQSSPDTGLDLPTPSSWTQPFQIYPPCSKPSMLVISDINPSFDSDQLPGVNSEFGSNFTDTDLSSLDVSDSFTQTDGINEIELPATDVFIGQNGTTFDYICSAKTISDMAQIRGLCPEEPTKQGSYYAAAVAHYGKTDFNNDTGYPNVTTYSVALASPIPDITIQVGSNPVTLVPVGKSVSGGYDVYDACLTQCDTVTYDANYGLRISDCEPPPWDEDTDTGSYCPSNTIVDFYVEEITATTGKFRINFEDVEQGADHDMDAIVFYEYEVIDSDSVRIKLTSLSAAGSIDQVLGFVITGTTEDGLYLPIKDADTSDAPDGDTPTIIADMPGGSSDPDWEKVFTVGGASPAATLLKDPLWYAAKWGGFEDINGNDIPDDTNEWDRDGDNDPDTYFLVHNPLELENELNKAFGEILKRISAGTAVSVLSTSASGEGSLFQAYFNPSVFDSGNEVTWVGYLNALWVDQFGNLREDTGSGDDPDQHLVLTVDPIIEFDLDVGGDTVVRKYSDTDGDGVADGSLGVFSLADLQPLWEGGEKLVSTSARTIYTFMDENEDGDDEDGAEWVLFTVDKATDADMQAYLNAAGEDEAADIINFIRGDDFTPLTGDVRPREIDGDTWKLGDIVYSTPTVVGRPSENYHLVYGDITYLDFVREYKNRKTVIYLGANDGMLHAFSTGDYHEGDDPSTADTEKGWYDGDFGQELWAYIPYNLLPQLKWLMDPAYCHVYYVDLKAKVVDARIFDNDGTHINGWGTVLVGAMRLGGKELTCNSRTFRSAYFALDITDPANPPTLLWEFTDSNLNYSTSYPAVFRVGTVKPYEANAQKGDWYVIFGSGPTTFDGDGAATGYIYIRNLFTGAFAKQFTIDDISDPVFTASPITIDLGLDYQVDVAYIGVSYEDSTDSRWEGKIYRIEIDEDIDPNAWDRSTFITFDQPITIAPVAALDPFDRLWLFWGTGRFFSNMDKIDPTVQRLYGVWDPGTATTINATGVPSGLNNVTPIRVHEFGYMDLDGDGYYDDTTFKQYLLAKRAEYTTDTKYGWYLNITSPIAIDGERIINSPTVLGNIVLFPSFKPEEDICDFGGSSYLYALYYETGTAYQESVIGLGPNVIDVGGNKYENLKRRELGAGMPTSVVIHAGSEEGVRGMVQLGTGVVEVVDIDPATSPQSKTIFWREKAD